MIKQDLLAKYKVKNNLLTRLDQAERKIRSVESADFQAPDLSAFAPAVGEVTEMRILAGDGDLEGGTYSGTAMVWPSIEINGFSYTFLGMNNGVLEFGLSALDGRAYFAGGAGVIDANGIDLTGIRYALRHYATDLAGLNARYGSFEMMFQDGKSTPSLSLSFMDATAIVNLLTNGDFATADFTGWTVTGSPVVQAFGSGYIAVCPGAGSTNIIVQNVAVTAGTLYSLAFSALMALDARTIVLYLRWKNAGGAIIKNEYIPSYHTMGSWEDYLAKVRAPLLATSVDIETWSETNGPYIQSYSNFVFGAVGISRKLFFDPDLTYQDDAGSRKVLAGVKEIYKPLPLAIVLKVAAGLCTHGYHYALLTFYDADGETFPSDRGSFVYCEAGKEQITVPLQIGPWGTVGRRVYLSMIDLVTYGLAADIPDNATTTIDLSIADASLGVIPPVYNTTGSRPLYPRHQTVMGHDFLAFNAAGTGIPLVLTNTASQVRYGFYANLAAADANDLDRYKADLFLEAGTYTVVFYGVRATTAGKVDLYIDGALIAGGPYDLYNASTDYDYTFSIAGVVITGSDYHLLEWRVNGKHASSTDYRVLLTCTSLKQAGY
jgi:hypothetical protein